MTDDERRTTDGGDGLDEALTTRTKFASEGKKLYKGSGGSIRLSNKSQVMGVRLFPRNQKLFF